MSKKIRLTDEISVWFTSIGLTIGLAMVVFLLWLVIANGVKVFWPDPVVRISFKSDAAGTVSVLGGEITKKQTKAVGGGAADEHTETQLFVGNKDVYGYSFKYIDDADIVKIDKPHDAVVIERMEYGNAIGFLKAVELKDGGTVLYGQPGFDKTLKQRLDRIDKRRIQIRDIEKKKIGKVNRQMEDIRLKQKGADRLSEASALEFRSKIAALEAEYQALAVRATALRTQQNEDILIYELMSGQEQRLGLGKVMAYHYMNQLNLFERLLLSLERFWTFLTAEPREANTEGGIFPAIFGTFVMTLLMSVAVTPFGVLAAIYLREYAKQGFLVRAVRIAVNNLAGVPSIVFGVFGLGFFVYFVGGNIDRLFFKEALPTPTFGTGGILWAALTLALMTVPVVIVATEEALSAVSRGTREGSLACGASKWQTIQHVVLPAAAPGIMTGLILAMARGAGEVAPLMLVGVVKLAPSLPLDLSFPFFHLDRKFMHLGFHIYDLGFQSPDSEAAKPMVFATTMLLIALVVLLNMTAIVIRERLRKKYAVGAF